jgi:hypothetical protein
LRAAQSPVRDSAGTLSSGTVVIVLVIGCCLSLG